MRARRARVFREFSPVRVLVRPHFDNTYNALCVSFRHCTHAQGKTVIKSL